MEKKKKAINGKAGGAKRSRGALRGRGGFRGRGARIKHNAILKKHQQQQQQTWQRGGNTAGNARGGFARNRFKKPGNLVRSRSNLSLNQKASGARGGTFNVRRGRGGRSGRFGLTRSRSRTNLTYNQGGFFTSNKSPLKRTSSLPNLRDPNSVHNRLGYQSPAQIAYRNRVKRAKQLLLQRQNQRLTLQNQFRMAQAGQKSGLLSMQPRTLGRQQILTSQRRFTTGGLRSDQIARAQRRAQYEQKLIRMNSARLTPTPNVNFMCTLGSEYIPTATRQRPLTLAQSRQPATIGTLRQLPRGRSPYRQSAQSLNMIGRPPLFGRQRSRSRSRSRSRTHNTTASDSSGDVDDRTFSEVMYSLSGNLGVTGRTLNDRFSI
ncbi:PREDICTED: uncharacterized protein LOC105570030 [Vollenhovia emeryi]|uniref:uncharacterized protein LOC105570030 n=1 Tax=Vollenhovia emeryi TaxID=411798 RepID=UPI0005F36768|nr:PREDICTED: uncharacterized protein LOC105570030 [Vollenhovia emeryi]XP_011882337.1 PREDICTED: uncharacterized protein LOC105570030 [Vollenhovia emeryi]XP_011882338.1 PREDICTED: uncharacterized protein LOC105570030 [Vollenhovia emeryi]